MSVMSGFRDSQRPQWNPRYNVDSTPPQLTPPPTIEDALGGVVEDRGIDVARNIKQYDYESMPQAPSTEMNLFDRAIAAGQGLQQLYFGQAIPAINSFARAFTGDTETQGVPGVVEVGTPVTLALDAEGPIFRGANTAISGTMLLANVGGNGIRPGEDGFSIGDLGEVYSRAWTNEITPGQALATNFAGQVELATSIIDNVLDTQIQESVDSWIERQNRRAIRYDPNNTRKLNAWMSGFHSDFDVDSEFERDSAFGQGIGRWITGGSDAAIYWFAGVDVLAAKGFTSLYRVMNTKTLGAAGVQGRGIIPLEEQRLMAYRHAAGTETNVVGEIIDSFVPMSKEQAAFHDIAVDSDNAFAVSNAIGAVRNRGEASDLYFALMGDQRSFAKLARKNAEAADYLKQAQEERDLIKRILEENPFSAPANSRGDQIPSEQLFSPFGWHGADEVKYYDNLTEQLKQERARIDDGTAFMGGGDRPIAQIGQVTRVGAGRTARALRVQRRAGAEAGYGKRSAQGMAQKAEARLARFNGSAFQHETMRIFGRPVRFVSMRSAMDKVTTYRQTGTIRFDDPNEFLREVKATLNSTPFLRRMAKAAARGKGGIVRRRLANGDVIEESVEEFRTRLLREAIDASNGSPEVRATYVANLENQMAQALASAYNVSIDDMLTLVTKYATARNKVKEHLKSHDWIKDGAELVVLDRQTLTTLRNGATLMDFVFVEKTMKMGLKSPSRGQNVAKPIRWLVEGFDALWRPLVLLRLGYTQRNVAEGWLRTLAAYGEIPTSGDLAQSAKFFMQNTGETLAGTATTFKRSVINRKGIKKMRREERRERSKLQQHINERDGYTTKDEGAVPGVKAEIAKSGSRIKRIRKAARRLAEQRVLARRRAGMEAAERPVYAEIGEELTAAQLRLIEDATTLIYDPGQVYSLHARALTPPNAATGEGVGDAELLTRSMAGDGADQLTDGDFPVYDFMTPSDQLKYDDLMESSWDEAAQNWRTPAAEAEHYRLSMRGFMRRTRQLMKDGYKIGRLGREGQFVRIRESELSKLTPNDFYAGRVVVAPKDVNPRYAKVDVYGEMLDLRTGDQLLGAKADVYDLRGGVEDFIRKSEKSQLLAESPNTPQLLNAKMKAGSDKRDAFDYVETKFEEIFGEGPESFFGIDRLSLSGELYESRVISKMEEVFQLIDSDPQVFRALAVQRWINANADRLPEGFIEWATKNKLILSKDQLKRLATKRDSTLRKKYEAASVRNDLRAYFEDPSNFPNDGRSLHAGREIEDDVLRDVWVTDHTMNYLHGPGLYSISYAPRTTSGYLVAHMSGNSDLARAGLATGDPVVYIMPDPSDRAWLDLDNFVYDDLGEINPQVEDLLQLLDTPDLAISNGTLGSLLRRAVTDEAIPVQEGMNATIGDLWRMARLEIYAGQVDNKAIDQAMYDVIDAIRTGGYDGLTHLSGVEGKPVYIWYAKDVPMERLEEISDNFIQLRLAESKVASLNNELQRIEDRIAREKTRRSLRPYEPTSMTTVAGMQDDNLFQANARLEQILTKYARERGYGGVYIDDPGTVEGYRALFVPDASSINRGYLDNAIPGQVADISRGNTQVADLSAARGKQLVEPVATDRPDAYDFDDFADYREALSKWEESGGMLAPDVPARALPDEATGLILRQIRDQDPDLYRAVTGPGSLSKTNKAKLAIWLEGRGYTHVLLPGSKGAEPTLVSASELVADRKTGLAYLRYGAKDEVEEVMTSILSKDERYAREMKALADAKRRKARIDADIEASQGRLRTIAAELDEARPSRRKKRRVGDTGDAEADKVVITGRQGQARLETGSFRDPNEAISGTQQELWSSGSTTDLMISGHMQNRYAQYQTTANYSDYSPSSAEYWLALESLVNKNIRQDPILRRLAAMPRVRNPEEISIQDTKIIDELLADPAFMKAARQGIYDLDNLPLEIDEMRQKLFRWIPDEEVRREAAKRELDADFLASRLAWRDDLVTISEREMVPVDGLVRRGINRAMNALGTVPEDNLIKAPFYRKRWTEEMQRQVDAAELEGQTSFTAAEIDSMRRVAHAYALRATRDTTYTITRMSTPAAAMAFLIPFFPAWENALRFWTKAFAKNPSNLARYIQLWNAPNAIGMVVDEDGNPVEGERGFSGLAGALVSPGETYINLPVPDWMKESIDKIPGFSLGTKGELRFAKGALNVALQGDYPWMANAGPIASVPVSYIAAQRPDYFDAVSTLEVGDAKVGDAIAKMFVPFGRPTAEKSILGAFMEQALPSAAGRVATAVQGMSDTQFVSTVEEIQRDMLIDWELSDRQGPEPTIDEAISRAREFFALRAAGNLLAFAAPGYQSQYQTEIEEWRRILQKHLDIEESYKMFGKSVPEGKRVGYQAAVREFLDLYGDAFFALTVSTSARSGIGASMGEYEILRDHGALAGQLAESDVNGTADFAAMLTSPYAGEYNDSVYVYQMDRQFENSEKLIRGGEREDVRVKTEIQRGWMQYQNGLNELEAIAEEMGTTIEQDPQLSMYKDILAADVETRNPAWGIAKGNFETQGYRQVISNLEKILDNEEFMRAHGSEPLWVDLRDYLRARNEIQAIIRERKVELGDQGSLNIKATSNRDIYNSWMVFIAEKKATNIAFSEYYNRWLDYDALMPGDPFEKVNVNLQIAQQEMAMGGVG